MKRGLISIIVLNMLVLFALNSVHATESKSAFSAFVDKKGTISLPKDFRKTMSHLGSWFVPLGDASGFHDVYARQTDISAYRKTGKFPDGAILVKELRASSVADYSTGQNVSFANKNIKQWFVMIKDTKNRFPKNKNWGDGWGWALFKTDNPDLNVSKNYKEDCLGCHLPAKANDWIYIEGYPTLTKERVWNSMNK